MICFLNPEFLWLLAWFPLLAVGCGGKGWVASIKYSTFAIAIAIAHETATGSASRRLPARRTPLLAGRRHPLARET